MFYLEPRLPESSTPSRLLVDVKVGHPFDAEVLPRMAHHIDRFVAIAGDGSVEPVVGIDGRVPAGVAAWSGEPQILAYRSHGVAQRMKRTAFLRYGEEEGVQHLIATQPPAPTGVESESYHRCAKALVGAPVDTAAGRSLASRPVECALDVVAMPGEGTFGVLFRGEPLQLVQVRFSHEDGSERTVRSDERGLVQVPLGEGRWIVSAVHLEPSGAGEWQSWWASFVFDVTADENAVATLMSAAG